VGGKVERLTSSEDWVADVSGVARGRVPQLAGPTAAGVAAIAMPMSGALSIVDAVSVEVRVRERFTFLR
jgi:hypothetical protein